MTPIKSALTPAYYATRQVSPFRGVLRAVEPGEVLARTAGGVRWHLHCKNAYGRLWPAGTWSEQEGATGHCTQAAALIAAIGARPPFPFPLADTLQLWLLRKGDFTPLAWLRTERPLLPAYRVRDLHWVAFSVERRAFTATCLRDWDASRPELACGGRRTPMSWSGA